MHPTAMQTNPTSNSKFHAGKHGMSWVAPTSILLLADEVIE
jgi:hypothetical protein